MKSVFMTLGIASFAIGITSLASAANTTMKGEISDSACGASHAKMIAQHTATKWTDRDCTLACIKAGSKYVFVADGKVYNISNQSLAALNKYAGQMVSLTGSVTGDTIAVSKVAAAK